MIGLGSSPSPVSIERGFPSRESLSPFSKHQKQVPVEKDNLTFLKYKFRITLKKK
jgi:hypothetical protein